MNDAPDFDLNQATVTVLEDNEDVLGVAQTTFPGFATGIVPGPATATDEATQNLTFDFVSVSAPELFAVPPAISPTTGDLTFTTAPHKNGVAVVVVRLVDDGPSSPAPNNNASVLRTFTISITPINDAPQFDIPSSIVVDEDAGLISQSGFATNVQRGPDGSDDENGPTDQL